MSRKHRITALAAVLICAAGLLVLNLRGTRNLSESWNTIAGNIDDWLTENDNRRNAASVVRTSKSFQFVPEDFSNELSQGVSFRFKNESGDYLILYLPHPSGGDAFLEKNGRKIQRIYACRRYGPNHGFEVNPGSEAERRLTDLIRTSLRPENEKNVRPALDALENRVFDWSLWRGDSGR